MITPLVNIYGKYLHITDTHENRRPSGKKIKVDILVSI